MDGDTLTLWGVWQAAEGRAVGTIYLQRRYLERLAARHDLATVTGEQLRYEGYTASQAKYGVRSVGL